MNIKNRLRHLADLSAKDRGMGRTTLSARAAKEIGGIVIANSHSEARQITKSHGVLAKSYEMNLEGYSGPFILDHHTVETLLRKAANKIESLEAKNERMVKKVMSLLAALQEDDEIMVKKEVDDSFKSGAV